MPFEFIQIPANGQGAAKGAIHLMTQDAKTIRSIRPSCANPRGATR